MNEEAKSELRNALLTYIQVTGSGISKELKQLSGITDTDENHSKDFYRKFFERKR